MDEGAGLRRKFNYEEANFPNDSKRPREYAESAGGQIGNQILPATSNLGSSGDDEAVLSPRNHESAAFAPDPLMTSIIGTGDQFRNENEALPDISPSPFVRAASGDFIGTLEQSTLARQSVVTADPTPNETISSRQPLMHPPESSLSDSVNSVFQQSAYHISTLSSLSERFIHQKEEDSHFEILFLMRHYAEVVGPWLVLNSLKLTFRILSDH